jgi:cell wall-associated NlpC family hydrolase
MQLDGAEEAAKTETAPKNIPTATQPVKHEVSRNVRMGSVGEVTANQAQIHRSRSTTSRVFSSVPRKTALAVIATKDGWYGVLMSNGATGWIEAKQIDLLEYDIVAPAQPTSRSGDGIREPSSELLQNELIKIAASYNGTRYVFGGENPNTGMDCSAFLRSVFNKFGIHLPRTARSQANVGVKVPFDQLQPGDRLYFACGSKQIDHCGIYAGNGYFIHCSSRRNGVGFDTLANNFYWNGLVTAKR